MIDYASRERRRWLWRMQPGPLIWRAQLRAALENPLLRLGILFFLLLFFAAAIAHAQAPAPPATIAQLASSPRARSLAPAPIPHCPPGKIMLTTFIFDADGLITGGRFSCVIPRVLHKKRSAKSAETLQPAKGVRP